MIMRKYTYKLYPKPKQAEALLGQLRLHQQLYNAALQERIDAYQKRGISITYNDQQASLTQIRAEHPEYKALSCTSGRMTLRRLDKAFKAFFARVKRGHTAGFPRFKSLNRFHSFELLDTKFQHGERVHGRLFIKGVGHIQARGKSRLFGKIKTSQVQHKYGSWWLSLTVETEPERECLEKKACGIDWGIEKLITLAQPDGEYCSVENPRYYKTNEAQQTALQQSIAKKKRGSSNWKKACKALSRFKRKQANQRKDAQHKLTSTIAGRYTLVAMEELSIKNMSRSAKGNCEQHGKKVKQKAGLNREILDTAPAALMSMIRYKVEETGGELVNTPTRKLKPSQRCPCCHHTHKGNRTTQANFTCTACGFHQNADVVSAYNSAAWALGLGREHVPEVFTSKPLLSTA